ncbi:MAG: formylglycine-generating enzyme family protein [Chloroflexi bacterium]|nr:formylglycine-generating enzyme family protein [Chloroflexota bacterium]
MRKGFLVTVTLFMILLALAACGDGGTGLPGQPGTGGGEPTVIFTPIVIAATPTPPPPPPTPTPRPKPTDAPTKAAEPTQVGATAVPTEAPKPSIDTPMLDIPAGSFQMGSDAGTADSKPPHKVDVAAFMLDQLEVTNGDFKKFVDATGYKTDAEKEDQKAWTAYVEGKENHPAVKISWNDANEFCKWVGKRLPTEAEWEYAARGAKNLGFPYGNDFDPKKQNGKESGLRGTAVVGSYPAGASPFGVLDMAGNVWEWTSTKAEHYPGNTTDSKLYGDNNYILRGGGWFDAENFLTAYYRNSGVPTTANDDLGFRCAK